MQNESTKKTLIVALGVCLVCSIFVSTAAVTLRGIQEKNQQLDKLKNILAAGNLMQQGADIQQIFNEKIEIEMVNLQENAFMSEDDYSDSVNPQNFDLQTFASKPEFSTVLPPDRDIADLVRVPKYMNIYRVVSGDSTEKYIFPIYGKGLWSTMYGFIALGSDLKTVRGITFYDHGETPGLGGEIDNPKWQSIWQGKKVYGDQGEVALTVIKGSVDPSDPKSEYKIDGLSGATITTRGLDSMIEFWLGDYGYGPLIDKLKEAA